MSNKQRSRFRKYPFTVYILLFILVLPILWNLLRPGFYVSDDGEWMAIRLTAFHQSLREGQFPVRWVRRLNHEYGYPVMNFLYPLPFYLAEPFYAITKDPVLAIKIIMGLSVLSMVFGMYTFVTSKGRIPAFVAAISYVYAPYVAYNLYQRGSLGETVAMGTVPWIFWAIPKKRFSLSSCLIAALILSHNVVAALFVPVIAVFVFFLWKKNVLTSVSCISLFTISFGLSAFFWFPAMTELRYVRASQISISDFENEYLSIGDAIKRTGFIQSMLTGGIPLYLLSRNSTWFWNSIPIFKIIQFPWRTLSVSAFLSSLVISWILWKLRGQKWILYTASALIIICVITSSWIFLRPQAFINRPASYYQTNDDTTTVRAEYTPIWVTELPKNRPDVTTQHYYPGWRAFDGAAEIRIFPPQQTEGILQSNPRMLSIPLVFRWSETLPRMIANLVSAVSLLAILVRYQGTDQQYAGQQ